MSSTFYHWDGNSVSRKCFQRGGGRGGEEGLRFAFEIQRRSPRMLYNSRSCDAIRTATRIEIRRATFIDFSKNVETRVSVTLLPVRRPRGAICSARRIHRPSTRTHDATSGQPPRIVIFSPSCWIFSRGHLLPACLRVTSLVSRVTCHGSQRK